MDTHKKTVIAAAGPPDLIATVWFTLGYRPRDSLVLIGLEGPRNQVGVMLRVDLPAPGRARSGGDPRPLDRVPPARQRALLPVMVRDLLTTIVASGARAVMAVVADEQVLDRRPSAVIRALRQGVREFGLPLIDVLGVTSTAFGSLLCRDSRCCPPTGWPISRVMSSRSAAAHVVGGDTVADSEADLLADVRPDPSAGCGSTADPPWDACPAQPAQSSRPTQSTGSAQATGSARAGPGAETELEQRWLWWRRWGQACAAAAGPVRSGASPAAGAAACAAGARRRAA